MSVEEPEKRKGERILQITVDVRVPGGDIVSVSRGTDAESVLREAFADLGRKLEEEVPTAWGRRGRSIASRPGCRAIFRRC